MEQWIQYWEDNWNGDEWAGCERACRQCYEDGINAGMLAAADIVGNLQKDYAHEVAINLALGYIERAREAAE